MQDNLTKLEEEKKKKREMEEDEDYLEEVDKPSGWKFVGQVEKDKQEKEKKEDDNIKNSVDSKGPNTYKERLAEFGLSLLRQIDIPKGWDYHCLSTNYKGRIRIYGKWFSTEEGILVVLKTNKNEVFSKGINISYDPVIDVGALKTLIVQVENTIDSIKGILLSDKKDGLTGLPKTKSGIILPN